MLLRFMVAILLAQTSAQPPANCRVQIDRPRIPPADITPFHHAALSSFNVIQLYEETMVEDLEDKMLSAG